jgi:hypothetical protein
MCKLIQLFPALLGPRVTKDPCPASAKLNEFCGRRACFLVRFEAPFLKIPGRSSYQQIFRDPPCSVSSE